MWISRRNRENWGSPKYTIWTRTPEDYPWVTAVECTYTLAGAKRRARRYSANTKRSESYSANDHVVWKD